MGTVRESDLRSLERRSMYSIFHPLDAGERLPRELLLEAKRHRTVGRREVAGMLWLPLLVALMLLEGWMNISGGIAIAGVGLLFAGLCLFALSDRQP